jgi:hypothetical protein
MKKCPNCSRPTKRTLDWACQWCGYPLVSKSYKRIPKTFRELKEERRQEQKQKSLPGLDTTTPTDDIVTTQEDSKVSKLEFTVEEILSVCKKDETNIATMFQNRTLVVTGVVANVVVDDANDIYYVSLGSMAGEEECKVNCTFDKKNSTEIKLLTEGQTVTVEGKYDDYELNILMKDCVLVNLPEREEISATPPSSDVILTSAPTPETELEITPESEPVAEPEPEPEKMAEPKPELPSTQETAVEPELEITPEPEPVAESEPELEKMTEPAAEPEPELLSAQETAVEPELEITSEPEPVAESEPELEITPEPVAEPEPEPEPAREPEPAAPAIEATIDELFSAYTTDEAAATEKFGYKLLQLTGTINRIEIQDYLDVNYINLTDVEDNQLDHVRCFFDKAHSSGLDQLTKGQKVTVRGTFVGSIVSMHLRDCVLVSSA